MNINLQSVPFNPVIALLAPTPFLTTRRMLLGLKRRAEALAGRRRGHHRSPRTQVQHGVVIARQSWHSFVKHLPRLGSVSGVGVMGYAIARNALGFVRPALVLFLVSAVSACAVYWRHARIEDARREESLFVSLALSVMLGVISLTWLVMYRSTDLPLDVAWFGLTVALFVAAFQRTT
jgi:hypothetical protein